MADDKHRRWAIKTPEGKILALHLTGIRAKTEFIQSQTQSWYTWQWYYKHGWRCVKVWVYQEPRVKDWVLLERNLLLDLTRTLDEHPEEYEGPCECKTCMSYADLPPGAE